MVRATISEVKNGLSAFLRQVRRGESVLVLDRKVPVACIVPPSQAPKGGGMDVRLARLEEAGIVVRRRSASPLHVLGEPVTSRGEVLDALLDERRDGR